MKKIFTLLVLALFTAVNVNAKDVTIYVQAEVAPYIWYWGGATPTVSWPGEQLTETTTKHNNTTNTDVVFWYKTITINSDLTILFNDGNGSQTGNLSVGQNDHYFTYDGTTGAEDVTEQYAELPDATISNVAIAGSFNGWSNSANSFTKVSDNTYTYVLDATSATEDILFKILPNGNWVGYSSVTLEDAGGYVSQAATDDNFQITAGNSYTLTATWAGGKDATQGWTLKVEKDGETGIGKIAVSTVTKDAKAFNLSGQRVDKSYKGIVIQKGRKYIQK